MHFVVAPRSDGMFHISLWEGEDIENQISMNFMLSLEDIQKFQWEVDVAIRRYRDGDTYEKL